MEAGVSREDPIFFNCSFDKKRLKALISWVFKQSGEAEALRVVDLLKETGFRHATKAGISIGLHDLMTPIQKSWLISESQLAMNTTESDFVGARITATERSQRIVDTWHRASESLSKEVVDYFGIYDRFNPVYVMALSGARGNFSQVRQLIGMRGLMADQQGKIVNFPIRSNLREGLTLTEYFISCSGARKGLVDTALRTADTGYLTRRLVDVSHHVVVKRVRCNTDRGILFKSLQSYNKVLLPLKERLVGRVLAEDVFSGDTLASSIEGALPLKTRCKTVARRDQEVSLKLALTIAKTRDKVFLRSPLTCGFTHSVCQLCYGWSISQGSLVSLGDAVGVIAAQSIGEPGTQLTMRTFHTGGVFSGDLLQEIRAPHAGKIEFSKAFQGLLIRTAHGRIAFLSKTEGRLVLRHGPTENENSSTSLSIPAFTMLFVRQGERVENNQLLAEYSIRTKEGNQPIKTQQTIFAQLSGRVVEDCSGKVYTRSIKESRLLLHTLENGELPPPASDGEPLPPLQGVYSSGARSCKGAVRQTAKRAIPPYTTFFEGGTFHLYHPPQMKKWRVQPLRLQGNNPPLSQIQSLNVPHSVQDRAVQEIFATRQSSVRGIRYSEHQDARLGRLSTLSKRFAFLNETRKKPFSLCKASLFSVHRDEDLENDAFKDVEPVRSGRLGFLKIVSIRVGATLDYISPTKPFDSSLKRRRGFDSFGARYLHPDCQKANRFLLQTVAEYGDVVEEGYALPTPEMTPIG